MMWCTPIQYVPPHGARTTGDPRAGGPPENPLRNTNCCTCMLGLNMRRCTPTRLVSATARHATKGARERSWTLNTTTVALRRASALRNARCSGEEVDLDAPALACGQFEAKAPTRAPLDPPPSSNRKWRLLRKSQAPRRWRDRIGVRVVPHSAGPNNSLRKRDNLEDRSPPRMASSNVNLGGASLRWTHPQPSKVADASPGFHRWTHPPPSQLSSLSSLTFLTFLNCRPFLPPFPQLDHISHFPRCLHFPVALP